MKHTYQYQDQTFSLELTPSGSISRVAVNGQTLEVELLRAEAGRLDLLIDGKPAAAYVTADGAKRWVTLNGQTFLLTKTSAARKNSAKEEHSAGRLLSPMPGQIRALQTSAGAAVMRGQTLLVLEAMKMEIKISAPFDGRVKTLPVSTGQTVEKEQFLIEIEP